MEKLYFRIAGSEPDTTCIDPCTYKDKPSEGVMVGSATCQGCISCYGWDAEENWVKCLSHSLKVKGHA